MTETEESSEQETNICFQSYKWEVDDGESQNKRGNQDNSEEEDGYTTIYVHGLDEKNRSVTVKIPDFKMWCYLELDSKIKWNSSKAEIVYSYIKNRLGGNKPIKKKFMEKTKIYYSVKAKFLKLTFNTVHGIKELERLSKQPVTIYGVGKIKLTIHEYENDCTPILKLQAQNKLLPSGWLSVKGRSEPFSSSDISLVSSYKDVLPVEKELVTDPLVVSYDIECVSSDKSGMTFPNPKKNDPVICISITMARYFDFDNKKNYALINEEGGREVNFIENTEILHFKNEKSLLLGWVKFINKYKPNVIISYNGLSFDDNYLAERANKNLCWQKYSSVGKIIGKSANTRELKWQSSAYGDQKFNYLDIPGIIHLDMFPIISKEYTNLGGYRLDDVSEEFLGEHKIDLPAKEMIQIYHAGGSENMKKIVEYCNQDTLLPFKLMKHLNSWISLIEMSNVMRIQMFDLITRGQQIRAYAQLYCYLYDTDFVLQARWSDYKPTDSDKEFVGATVQNPRVGLWKWVTTFDFKSLYPTTIIAYNLCFSTFIPESVPDPDPELFHNLTVDSHQGCEHDTTIRKSAATRKICKTETFRFWKAEVKKGLFPTILENLLSARDKAKKTMKEYAAKIKESTGKEKERYTVLHSIYNKRQNGLKISSNSLYGALGSEYSKMPFYPAAACTTAMGRYSIQQAIDYTCEKYKDTELVYGDSVTGDTPIIVKKNGVVSIVEIQNLGEKFIDYPGFKMFEEGESKQRSDINNVEVWTSSGWRFLKRVIKHRVDKKIYRISTETSSVDVTEDHSLLLPNKTQIKPCELEIGQEILTGFPEYFPENIFKDGKFNDYILNSNQTIKEAYLEDIFENNCYITESKLESQIIYYIAKSLGIELTLNSSNNFVLTLSKNVTGKNVVEIRLLHENYNDYVYDLETEDGTFHAGIGEIIVKNTDSAMFHFTTLKSHTEVFERSRAIEKEINSIFPSPMFLEHEDVSGNYLLLKKKNYLKEIIDETGKVDTVEKKGVVSKRRDNCALIRENYMLLVNLVMKHKQIWDIYRFLEKLTNDILNGKIDLESLIITKSIKENYKSKNLPHLVVANKMRERGKYVVAGTRIPYIFIKTEKYNEPQYIKAEDPDYYLENKDSIDIDYLYYFEKQMINPIDEILEVVYKKQNVLKNLFLLYRKGVVKDAREYFSIEFIVE